MTSVVAVVPAFNRSDTVAATVSALLALPAIHHVVVVDDGSADNTSERAAAAGARVVTLPANEGKAAAVLVGVEASAGADVLVFIDADTGSTAAEAAGLIDAVLNGHTDMAIAVLPSAAGRGGFGFVRDVAAALLKRGTGRDFAAPLSGQRAIRSEALASLCPVDRFGLEVALTLDVIAAGFRVDEIEAHFDHRHTGRSVAGFAHRGRQGRDLLVDAARRLGWPATIRVVAAAVVHKIRNRQ